MMMAGAHSVVMIEDVRSRSRKEGKQKLPTGDYIIEYGDIDGYMRNS